MWGLFFVGLSFVRGFLWVCCSLLVFSLCVFVMFVVFFLFCDLRVE